jgi:hypothetical protein
MDTLQFIADDSVRDKIRDAIDYSLMLREQSKNLSYGELFQEETNRVIVLYIASTIEAILLYIYSKRTEKMTATEYKHVSLLPSEYVHTGKGGNVVVAVATLRDRKEFEIGLKELIVHFNSLGIVKKETYDNILELNDLRNTHHLSKSRTKKCSVDDVERFYKLLLHTLENSRRLLIAKAK